METSKIAETVTDGGRVAFNGYVGPRVEGEPESARARAIVHSVTGTLTTEIDMPAAELDRITMEWLHARGKFELDAFRLALVAEADADGDFVTAAGDVVTVDPDAVELDPVDTAEPVTVTLDANGEGQVTVPLPHRPTWSSEYTEDRLHRDMLASILSAIEQNDPSRDPGAHDPTGGTTLAELYAKRGQLIYAAMSTAMKLGMTVGCTPDEADPEYVIAFIDIPEGQLSWHMPAYPFPWDGHTTAEKYQRAGAFIASVRGWDQP